MTNQQMLEIMGLAAAVGQAAEEAIEYGHALMKVERVLRGESPTPVTLDDAWAKAREEYGDMLVSSDLINMRADLPGMYESMNEKRNRCAQRLKELTER